ncbi:MAG: hypothetical protein IT310_02925 [Anaerolineales bacterium]|nr:hypothetical protein [Anaerolineales bacterium]
MKKLIWGLTALLVLIPSFAALAKGDFTYITVKGPGVTGELTVSHPNLIQFFSFSDFSKAVEAPAEPGDGYQVLRVFVVDGKEQPFDLLYYYPTTGFVYYEGLANGSSEYDKKWYVADPAAKAPFQAALRRQAQLMWYPLGVIAILLLVFYIAYRKKPSAPQQA